VAGIDKSADQWHQNNLIV